MSLFGSTWELDNFPTDFECMKSATGKHHPILSQVSAGNAIEASRCSKCLRPIVRPTPQNPNVPRPDGWFMWLWAAWLYVIEEEPSGSWS